MPHGNSPRTGLVALLSVLAALLIAGTKLRNDMNALDAQIEKQKTLNAREEKRIADAKEKINFFSNK